MNKNINILYYKACIRFLKENNIYEKFINNFKNQSYPNENFFEYLNFYIRYKFHNSLEIQKKIRKFRICGLFKLKNPNNLNILKDVYIPSNIEFYCLMTKQFLWLFKWKKIIQYIYISMKK